MWWFIPVIGHALLGGLIGGAVGFAASFVISEVIDEKSLKPAVKREYRDAFKLLIQRKKKSAVKVGIFDEVDDELASNVEIASTQGVSDSLHVGQVIYL